MTIEEQNALLDEGMILNAIAKESKMIHDHSFRYSIWNFITLEPFFRRVNNYADHKKILTLLKKLQPYLDNKTTLENSNDLTLSYLETLSRYKLALKEMLLFFKDIHWKLHLKSINSVDYNWNEYQRQLKIYTLSVNKFANIEREFFLLRQKLVIEIGKLRFG